MNFQDLFARYREMGAMAPQHSLDEHLLMLNGEPQNMDLQRLEKSREGAKKERCAFKLPSPNTFQTLLMSMDQEHKQGLLGDDEVEDLFQPSPPLQQGWNLSSLKTNNLCKEYYKLTSNMLHTLIMGIKELTDGELPSAWQVARDRGYQKQSNLSNTFLQDVANNSTTPTNSSIVALDHDGSKPSTEPPQCLENTCGMSFKPTLKNNGGQTPPPKEIIEKVGDIEGILELRKLLWRQIVPCTNLGATWDLKQNGDNRIKLLQESRMKVVNNVGFGVNFEKNSAFHETSPVSLTIGQQVPLKESNLEVDLSPSTHSMDPKQIEVTPSKISRTRDDMETKCVDGDEDLQGRSTSCKEGGEHEATKTEYSVSFPEEDVDMQFEEEFGGLRDVNDTQPLKRSKFSVLEKAIFEQPRSRRSKFCAKETRFSIDGQILPLYDEEFKIVGEEKEKPSRSHDRNFLGYSGGEDSSNQSYLGDRHLRQPGLAQCKGPLIRREKSTTGSWCIVGSFNSRSPTTSRMKYSSSQKTTK